MRRRILLTLLTFMLAVCVGLSLLTILTMAVILSTQGSLFTSF